MCIFIAYISTDGEHSHVAAPQDIGKEMSILLYHRVGNSFYQRAECGCILGFESHTVSHVLLNSATVARKQPDKMLAMSMAVFQ